MLSDGLIGLSRDMYDGYGVSGEAGIAYFKKYESRLRSFPYSDVAECLMLSYPNRYVVDFFLSTPFLWRELPAGMWVQLLERKCVSPLVLTSVEEVAIFSDIEFMNRYIGVDALRFIAEREQPDSQKRRDSVAYFRRFPDLLVRSDLDQEDLDGKYFVASNELFLLAETLCREFGFKRFDVEAGQIDSYLAGIAV